MCRYLLEFRDFGRLCLFDQEWELQIDEEMERSNELLKEIQDNPTDINAIIVRRRKDFNEEFFRYLTLMSETFNSLEDRDGN